jgi:hypothetical protein
MDSGDELMSEHVSMFCSVIAYGIAYIAALLVAGVALGDPLVIGVAVLTAGGSYLTQALGSLVLFYPLPLLRTISMVLWAATVALGLWGATLVVL